MNGATVTLSELPSFVTRDAMKTTEEVRLHQELGERTTDGVFNAVPGRLSHGVNPEAGRQNQMEFLGLPH